MSGSFDAYESPGDCVRFPDRENRVKGIGALRNTTEEYCCVAPDLFLCTNAQIRLLQRAGVKFEYVKGVDDQGDLVVSDLPDKVLPDPEAGASPWKSSLLQYRPRVALEFPSKEDAYRAIDLINEDDLLFGMPFDFPGRNSIIVPVGAVEYFRSKGLRFVERRVSSAYERS